MFESNISVSNAGDHRMVLSFVQPSEKGQVSEISKKKENMSSIDNLANTDTGKNLSNLPLDSATRLDGDIVDGRGNLYFAPVNISYEIKPKEEKEVLPTKKINEFLIVSSGTSSNYFGSRIKFEIKNHLDIEYQKRIWNFIPTMHYERKEKKDDKLKIKYVDDIFEVIRGRYYWYSTTTYVKQTNGAYMLPSFGNVSITQKLFLKTKARTSLK